MLKLIALLLCLASYAIVAVAIVLLIVGFRELGESLVHVAVKTVMVSAGAGFLDLVRTNFR